MGTFERLDWAERWMRNGLEVLDAPGGVVMLEADMTVATAVLEACRRRGTRVTYTHLVVRAAALVLARNPELHQHVAGSRRWQPSGVHVALSVAGDSFVAPVVVVRDAEHKSLAEISEEIRIGAPRAREDQRNLFRQLRRWGCLVPWAWLRRMILRFLLHRLWLGRNDLGTFQVTCLPEVDCLVSLLIRGAAILGVGKVQDRVVPIDGLPAVRRQATLACTLDHRIWDGRRAARFLNAVKNELENCAGWADAAVGGQSVLGVAELPRNRVGHCAEEGRA
jgi:pyruvate dehydrogenase E2 component (dihydrolipoamide acetyltransferase)